MLSFAWRWCQAGDRVLVHRDGKTTALQPGVVTFAERPPPKTFVSIRLDGDDSARVYADPSRVHPDPLDPEESCSLCEPI